MDKLVYGCEGEYKVVAVGDAAPEGGVLAGLIRDGEFDLVVTPESVDRPTLVAILELEGVAVPALLRESETVSIEDVRVSLKELVDAVASAARREYDNITSPRTKEAVSKVAEGVRSSAKRVGGVVDETIKPTFVTSSNRAIITALGLTRRDLLSLRARLTEEALTLRLESMSDHEKADFNAKYIERLTELDGTAEGAKLASWNKVVRRLVR